MAEVENQRVWRRSTAPASITVHLNGLDAATLDAIAIELYRTFPHDPPNGVESPDELGRPVYPGRPEAIRWLCSKYRQQAAKGGRPTPFQALIKLRDKLAKFWVAEASWRRAKEGTTGKRPVPPWREPRKPK